MDFFLLLIAAFAAGFVDAVIGGGGLVQLPAVFFYLPEAPVPVVFGTNKFAGFAGTSVAAIKYFLKTNINWPAVLPAIIAALPAAFLGAKTLTLVNKETVKPLVLVMFILVAVYTFIKKDFGLKRERNFTRHQTVFLSLITGLIIGFYDGFFGPGTGSFLVFIYVFLFGFDFLTASAGAKIVNAITNISALIFFMRRGEILFSVAIPVAIMNIAGSLLGAGIAIRKGSGFIRVAFLIVVSLFILKMAWEIV